MGNSYGADKASRLCKTANCISIDGCIWTQVMEKFCGASLGMLRDGVPRTAPVDCPGLIIFSWSGRSPPPRPGAAPHPHGAATTGHHTATGQPSYAFHTAPGPGMKQHPQ